MVKQVIVMRKDLGMRKGKMIAQGSHASLAVVMNQMERKDTDSGYNLTLPVGERSSLDIWLSGNFKKICLYVSSEKELLDIYENAKEKKLPVVLIEDSGLTEFNGVKTKTCLAIGPDEDEKIDKITSHLKLL
jgi:peptidyl-tRNA hydrolase, PTH2 family